MDFLVPVALGKRLPSIDLLVGLIRSVISSMASVVRVTNHLFGIVYLLLKLLLLVLTDQDKVTWDSHLNHWNVVYAYATALAHCSTKLAVIWSDYTRMITIL